MSMRGDWKFYATVSFCHTFRSLLKLPKFTADQLGASVLCVCACVLACVCLSLRFITSSLLLLSSSSSSSCGVCVNASFRSCSRRDATAEGRVVYHSSLITASDRFTGGGGGGERKVGCFFLFFLVTIARRTRSPRQTLDLASSFPHPPTPHSLSTHHRRVVAD